MLAGSRVQHKLGLAAVRDGMEAERDEPNSRLPTNLLYGLTLPHLTHLSSQFWHLLSVIFPFRREVCKARPPALRRESPTPLNTSKSVSA